MSRPVAYFRCSAGHAIAALVDVERCPVYIHGRPCPGEVFATDSAGRRRKAGR